MNNNLPKPQPFNQTNFIPFIPEDINRLIYRDHLWFDMENKPICDDILHWFNSTEASCLKYNDEIANKLSCLLNCKTSIEYLRKNDKEFDKCYIDHYIRNRKIFELMTNFESFILSILMHKYH